MWEFLLKNKEWIFSGIGATIIGVFLSLVSVKRKKQSKPEKHGHNIQGSSINGSSFTSMQGENINYHQNIFQSANGDSHKKVADIEIPIEAEDLLKTKEDYIFQKTNLRKFIYRVISPAKNINVIIQTKDVVDAAEDKLNINYKAILQELNEMESEGLITFTFEKPQDKGSPYNQINLTSKFFKTIKE